MDKYHAEVALENGADLSGANLYGAYLSGADLDGAIFRPGWKIVRSDDE